MVPLSIEGKVNCGQCVSCSQQLLQASFARPPPPPQLSQLQTPPPARKRLSLIEDDDGDEPSSTEATVSFVDDGLTDDSGRDSLFDGSHQQEQRQPCQQNEFAITSSTRSQEPSVYYEGDMNAYGQPHGGGDMIFANGDRYYGQFLNGKLHGKGTMLFVNGTYGNSNCACVQQTIKPSSDRQHSIHAGSTYVGSWECGYMHGSGTFHFQNGDVYEGEYQNSKRCGHGRMEFINGDLYVGSWQGGQMHGLGKYLYHNHHKFEGTFAMGARHGKGKYQYPDGEIIIHKYVRDQRMGEGVQFSADRKQVWRTVGGKRKGRITLRQAEVIMLRCEEEEEY